MTDLVVLVPDADIERVLRGLLRRHRSLGIRQLDFKILLHPMRDPGRRVGSAEILRPLRRAHRRALVVFDRHGCGSRNAREAIQRSVEQSLELSGWKDKSCKAIVIEPEVEVWLWNGSAHIARALGWDRYVDLQRYLRRVGLWPEGAQKPTDPKQGLRRAHRAASTRRKRWSPRSFAEIAGTTTLRGCVDPAFVELRDTLRRWFPPRWTPVTHETPHTRSGIPVHSPR